MKMSDRHQPHWLAQKIACYPRHYGGLSRSGMMLGFAVRVKWRVVLVRTDSSELVHLCPRKKKEGSDVKGTDQFLFKIW